MGRGGPPMGRGGPPMGRGGPSLGRGGPPPIGRGGPHPMGRGEPMDRYWEEPESVEYPEEGDPYWEEMRPPMRGMRPPFPLGRGRPPRGHPSFMHQGQGRPPHPGHGPMDREPLGHEIDSEDTEMDPSRHPMYHGHDPHSHAMHPEVGRGRRRVPPLPHEMMDPMEEPMYDEGFEGELGPPHGRGRPMAPHEMVDMEDISRRPRGRGMARGMWRSGPTHQAYEEGFNEGYVQDYGHGEDGYRWRPMQEYPPEDFRDDAKYRESEWDRGRAPPERDYPPRIPPSEPYSDSPWPERRERGHLYPYDENNRGRGELRIREYRDEPPHPPPTSEWDRAPRIPPPAEREYSAEYEDRRTRYEEQRDESPFDRPPPLPPAASVTKVAENSVGSAPQGTSGTNVLALSQHQHEIILKAAQELKFIR